MQRYDMLILPATYFAPAGWYALMLNSNKILVDGHEHFIKQTVRSRCGIYGANGPQLLSVPIEKRGNHIPAKDVRISYKEDWQKIHWRSLVSAYRNSAYFEYYQDELEPFFQKKHESIFELDMNLHELVCRLLKVKIEIEFTEKFQPDYGSGVIDLRNEKMALPELPVYRQVFEARHGFMPGLSILDLLFNEGPDSLKILNRK